MAKPEFDAFAQSYEQDLAKSLAATGEGREFYAQGRVDWTAECVRRLNVSVRRILDYGCGDGANLPMLAEKFRAERVLGVDISSESIAVARRTYGAHGFEFLAQTSGLPTVLSIWPLRMACFTTSHRVKERHAWARFAAL